VGSSSMALLASTRAASGGQGLGSHGTVGRKQRMAGVSLAFRLAGPSGLPLEVGWFCLGGERGRLAPEGRLRRLVMAVSR